MQRFDSTISFSFLVNLNLSDKSSDINSKYYDYKENGY